MPKVDKECRRRVKIEKKIVKTVLGRSEKWNNLNFYDDCWSFINYVTLAKILTDHSRKLE
jgi:hypothetical protein